jgi:hypothetical protein
MQKAMVLNFDQCARHFVYFIASIMISLPFAILVLFSSALSYLYGTNCRKVLLRRLTNNT